MKAILYILIILFLISNVISKTDNLPSDLIWNKVTDYIYNEKMNISNEHHFIFDESNYTQLDINNSKMIELYQKQENVYQKNKISNYIFIADNINEKEEKIEKAADNLYGYIEVNFGIDISNSVIALFSMESRRIRIKIGKETQKHITDRYAQEMIDHLSDFLKKKEYYNALIKLIDDIDEYYNKQSQLWLVLVCILSPCVLGIIIGAIICGKSDKNSGSDSSYNYDSGFTGGDCGGGGGGGATGGW